MPGRLRSVELTERGHAVFHDAETTARATSEALLGHLDPGERSALIALLVRFADPEPS